MERTRREREKEQKSRKFGKFERTSEVKSTVFSRANVAKGLSLTGSSRMC